MMNSSLNPNFRTRALLTLLSCTLSLVACSSQNDTGAQAGAAGMTAAGGPSFVGTSGGGSGGSSSGTGGSAGSNAGTGGLGGNAGALGGTGGSSGSSGSSGAGTLGADCAATCSSQTALDCTNGPDCQTDCLAPANTTNPNVTCQAEYTAMIHCDAPLQASQWMCSQDAAPVPVAGQCADAVCAYACCVGALVADQDLWSRCMPLCAQ